MIVRGQPTLLRAEFDAISNSRINALHWNVTANTRGRSLMEFDIYRDVTLQFERPTRAHILTELTLQPDDSVSSEVVVWRLCCKAMATKTVISGSEMYLEVR